jgi:hypothetical protein
MGATPKKTEEDGADLEPEGMLHPLDVVVTARMERDVYKDVVAEWHKASDRTIDDPEGAITSARTMLETACKHILREMDMSPGANDDLPQLYRAAAAALGCAPSKEMDELHRRIFGSAFQIMQAIGEMRNRWGDAHGKAMSETKVSRAQAELAVNLAGSLASFLASRLESLLTATKRRTIDGKVILKFDKTMVWRLLDHAINAPRSKPYYGKKVGHCLMLVGDAGIYLISNGDPPISYRGVIPRRGQNVETPLLVANAEGCGPEDEFDDWWPLHNLISGGDDFSFPIKVKEFEQPLWIARRQIVIVVDKEGYALMSDVEYEKGDAHIVSRIGTLAQLR